MSKTVRTRFAPSPTGYLHIGGARTALYSWLFARQQQGQFILRVEDTDLERSTEASVQAILDGMAWLGLDYDEGPFYQTKRMARYTEVIEQLLEQGHAYRCYCSKARLDDLREKQMAAKQKPKYDGRCRDCNEMQSGDHVIRFRNPQEGDVVFQDLVRGEVTVSNAELDDLIIARSDGSPTYNFTVVVDDWDMKISHVIRGDDHINNTPRQINILNALGAELPIYAHLPMILGEDGKRLSKRHGAVSVMEYEKEGILPEALLNFLVRLGWSHGDEEIFSTTQMIELFNFEKVSKSPAALNRDKLLWVNQHYLKETVPQQIVPAFEKMMTSLGVDMQQGPAALAVVEAQAERCKTVLEMAEKSRYFYEAYTAYDEKAAKKNLKPETADILAWLLEAYQALADWQPESIHQVIHQAAEHFELKLGKIAQPLRIAATGGAVSPPLDVTLALIGQKAVISRLEKTIAYCKNS